MKQNANPMIFAVVGKEAAIDPLHYTLCGLDNVILLNGFIRDEIDGEIYTAVEDVEGLHQMIALRLAVLLRPLTAKEVRFLRKFLDITQERLGKQLGVTRKSVVDYERNLKLPRTSQIVLQATVVQQFLDNAKEQLASSGEVPTGLQSSLDSVSEWTERVKDEVMGWLLKIREEPIESDVPPAFVADKAIRSWKIEASNTAR